MISLKLKFLIQRTHGAKLKELQIKKSQLKKVKTSKI